MRVYRTFVQLSPEERRFVETIRLAARKTTGKKGAITLDHAIRLIIRDYKSIIDERRDDRLLAAARSVVNEAARAREGAPTE